jgi:hypothetical protein
LPVKTHFTAAIANIFNGFPNYPWQIRITLGGYFAGDYSHTGGNHGFTGNMGVRILLKEGIKNRVRNLVRDLVGMPFCY